MKTLEIFGIRLASAILRNAPTDFGRYRLVHTFLPKVRQHGNSMGTAVVRTRHGFRLHTYLDDWLGQYVYLTGSYEPATARLFELLIAPGTTVLDIGANVGFFSLLSATATGQLGRVLSFEPAPRARTRLQDNIRLNGLKNVEIMPFCASEGAGTVTLYEGPEEHTGISSMRPIGRESAAVSVESRAVDSFIDQIGQVSLVKIDVEGAELLALKGMQALIERDHPFLIVEITDNYLKAFGHDSAQMLDWLGARTYRVYRIEDKGLTTLTKDTMDPAAQFNVLCVPNSCRSALPPELADLE